MKILRFNDDRIGILKNGDRVVDVSDTIKYRSEKLSSDGSSELSVLWFDNSSEV